MFTAQHGHEQVALVLHEAGAVLSNMGPGGEGWGPALVEPLMPVDAGM